MKKIGFILFAGLIAFIGLIQLFFWAANRGYDAAYRHQHTLGQLFMAGHIARQTHDATGQWPQSLEELSRFSYPENLQYANWEDGWENELHFYPYDASKSYGYILSLGRDGKPGGEGRDADIIFRYNESTIDRVYEAGPRSRIRHRISDPPLKDN